MAKRGNPMSHKMDRECETEKSEGKETMAHEKDEMKGMKNMGRKCKQKGCK